MERATTDEQLTLLLRQAEMIHEEASTVPEPADRADVVRRYEALRDMQVGLAAATAK